MTAAHEFFHAVQAAYDWFEDAWFMESTAAWMEDEVYTDINDNLQYLTSSPLRHPEVPLDFGNTDDFYLYGAWIWWRFLSEYLGDTGSPTRRSFARPGSSRTGAREDGTTTRHRQPSRP